MRRQTHQSGESVGFGELKRHGRGSLRALLIQASKRLLKTDNPLQKWGLGIALRRRVNRAAVAVARKLTVALKGRWSVVDEPGQTLLTKLHKLATELGVATLKELGYAGKEDFRQKKLYILKTYP